MKWTSDLDENRVNMSKAHLGMVSPRSSKKNSRPSKSLVTVTVTVESAIKMDTKIGGQHFITLLRPTTESSTWRA